MININRKNFYRRLEKFWKLAPEKNTVYIVSNPADIFYLLGVELDKEVFLTIGPEKDKLRIFCPRLYDDACLQRILPEMRIMESPLLKDMFFQSCRTLWPVAVNPKNINADFFLWLQKVLGTNLHFYDFTDTWRMIKEPSEIKKISRAAKIIARVVEQVCRQIRRGVREREIANEIVRRIHGYGGEVAFEPIVAFGKNTAYPHHKSNNTHFSGEGPVLIDAGCRFQGYCSDITRTYHLGRMSPLFLRIYQLVSKAKILAEKAVSLGKKFSEIDQIAQKLINDAGFGKDFVHGIGHGVGVEVHESPFPGKDIILKENMVFTIEPGIYLPGKFGVRLEDTILLTKNSAKILTVS